MIHNFSASYAGCIVDDNVGFEGTLANDRWYSNEALVQTFDWALDIAQHMDGLGYKEFWMAEHHFQHEGYEGIPNLLMLGLYLATQTKNLRFGCGFNIVPMWHPLRLAEDFAMADILTKGRVIFGVGRGYHTREVETFGAPMLDGDANRSLFEEQVELILKAFPRGIVLPPGRALPDPRRQSPTGATPWRSSAWCPGPSASRWRCGSPSSAPIPGASPSWPGTKSSP